MFHHATTDGADVLLTALLAVATWSFARFAARRRAPDLWLCGILLGYGIVTKPTVAALVPAFVLAALVSREYRRGWVAIAAPAAVGVAVTFWLNTLRFGGPFATGYNEPVMTGDVLRGVVGLTVGPNKGLLWYAPAAALGVLGLWRLLRTHAPAAIALGGSSAALLLVTARFYDWGGGWTWGPRYLLPMVPGLVACGALLVRHRWGRAMLAVAATAGVALTLLGVLFSEDAYRQAISRVWIPEASGTVRAGDTVAPGTVVDVVVPPEDSVPAFSSIAGLWWLMRLTASGCACTPQGACGCATGPFETHPVFLDPPWVRQFPEAQPVVPYGMSLIRPRLARAAYAALVFTPAEPAETAGK